ncbi:MAG TPA: tetratricopeptide repeat protein, partial [Burkholderiaceae bacterium]|nr:tetratricopeptide repeat protein [Burkholderiaceae bacterium]
IEAAPLESGRPAIDGSTKTGETPAAREFRAGVQAHLKGDMITAREKFEASLKLDPNYAPALIGLAGVAQAEGNNAQAEQYLQRAERASPKSPDVQLAWGRYYLRNSRLDAAEKAFLKARELAPKTIPPLLELGEVYIRTPGRASDAVRMYRAAVALDNNNKFAQYGLGIALAATGKRDEALKALEKASQLTPKDPAALRAIGRMHMESGELNKALVAFDRGLERQPQFIPVMLDRGELLARMNRTDEAIAQMSAAEKLAPDSAEVQFRLADVYQGAKRYPEAERAYLKAISLAPKNPLAYNNLAWMMVVSNGDAKKAVELANKAVELSPKSSPLYDTLGWAQRAAGSLTDAQGTLKRAIELEPNVAVYYYHLGIVQRDLKLNAAARASLQRALELDPKLPQADEARRLVKELAAQ